jgi:hypothetical protein
VSLTTLVAGGGSWHARPLGVSAVLAGLLLVAAFLPLPDPNGFRRTLRKRGRF